MEDSCKKCLGTLLPNKWMEIETEAEKYYFCDNCIIQAEKTLSMKIYLNKEDRAFLKQLRKYLKKRKLYSKN